MTFSLELDKRSKVGILKIASLSDDISAGIEKGFKDFGDHLVRTAENQALNEPKFGRTYRIKDKESGVVKLHRASKPGQSPALLTGDYVESFGSEANGAIDMEFGNNSEHARYLEHGTKKMERRPGVKNAVEASLMDGRMLFETNLSDMLQK